MTQLLLHPSPLTRFPSSHCYGGERSIASPHIEPLVVFVVFGTVICSHNKDVEFKTIELLVLHAVH